MSHPRRVRQTTCLVLGALLWSLAGAAVLASVSAVRSRTNRPCRVVSIQLAGNLELHPGDAVFVLRPAGLDRVGEVTAVVRPESRLRIAALSIEPRVAGELNASTRVSVWQTPLSAQGALESLLPAGVLERVAAKINEDWRSRETEIAVLWTPVLAQIGEAYLRLIVEEFRVALQRQEERLWSVARRHGDDLARRWPTIQQRLAPILEDHVMPILRRMLSGALSEAPKVDIALLVAKLDFAGAFQQMVDALARYLATMPEHERQEMEQALRRARDEARRDPVLARQLSEWSGGILHDEELQQTLSSIYREAFGENPRNVEFMRRHVLESEMVQARLFETVESFGPTARSVLEMCLFDDRGATRPEVVHLLRSVSLQRRLAWVTLEVPDPEAPSLPEGAVLSVVEGDPR
jgi:hypothetical protein